MTIPIKVAQQFSRYPAGRYLNDGPYSGQHFRERFLLPYLQGGQKVIVYLDGTRGYGSSFLEEAFGGLVRLGFSAPRVRELVELVSADTSVIQEIWDYVDHA